MFAVRTLAIHCCVSEKQVPGISPKCNNIEINIFGNLNDIYLKSKFAILFSGVNQHPVNAASVHASMTIYFETPKKSSAHQHMKENLCPCGHNMAFINAVISVSLNFKNVLL